jgi:hypothetical protein
MPATNVFSVSGMLLPVETGITSEMSHRESFFHLHGLSEFFLTLIYNEEGTVLLFLLPKYSPSVRSMRVIHTIY